MWRYLANKKFLKVFACLATASLGNLIMFIAGLGFSKGALAVMYLGRVVMGLGVGGVDSVVSKLNCEKHRACTSRSLSIAPVVKGTC